MGMRQGQSGAVQHAPEGTSGADLSDFENAFGGMFDGEQTPEPKAQERFASNEEDEELEEEVEQAQQKQVAPVEQEIDPLDGIEMKRNQAREKYKLQKENKDLKERLERLEQGMSEKKPQASKNPFAGLKPDDIVQQALAAMEDDGMTSAEAKEEMKSMTPAEIIAKAKEELRKELSQEREQEVQKTQETQAIQNYKRKIEQFASESADKYPVVGALGATDQVYQLIEQDFEQNEKEFGFDYAMENMLPIEAAVKKVNQALAQEVRNALKSPHMRNYILSAIKEESGQGKAQDQSEDFSQLEDEISTLTNSVHKRVTDPKDIRSLTDEEALEQSFAYLSN